MKDAVHGSPNRVESQAVVLAAELGKDGTLAAMAISLSSPISGEPVPVHATMVGTGMRCAHEPHDSGRVVHFEFGFCRICAENLSWRDPQEHPIAGCGVIRGTGVALTPNAPQLKRR
jgi:hypothetical protein